MLVCAVCARGAERLPGHVTVHSGSLRIKTGGGAQRRTRDEDPLGHVVFVDPVCGLL